MGRLNVLIVEDEPPARDRLARALAELAVVAQVETVESGTQALAALSRERYDLVLLDVELPGIDGLTAIQHVPRERRPAVVVVTAHPRYAIDAFDVEAVDCLAKPWTRERLSRAIDRVVAATRDQQQQVLLKTGPRMVLVDPRTIVTATAARNYVRVRTAGGDHLARETLAAFERRLPDGEFVRVHRSVVVRIDRVERLTYGRDGEPQLVLVNGGAIRVGRTRLAAVRRAIEGSAPM